MQNNQKAANRFLFLITNKILNKTIFPNYSECKSDSIKDFEKYLRFINSSDFDEFRSYTPRDYDGDTYY